MSYFPELSRYRTDDRVLFLDRERVAVSAHGDNWMVERSPMGDWRAVAASDNDLTVTRRAVDDTIEALIGKPR